MTNGTGILIAALAGLGALAYTAHVAITHTYGVAWRALEQQDSGSTAYADRGLHDAVSVGLVDYLVDECGFERSEAERRVDELLSPPVAVDAVGYAFHDGTSGLDCDDDDLLDDDCPCSADSRRAKHGGMIRMR